MYLNLQYRLNGKAVEIEVYARDAHSPIEPMCGHYLADSIELTDDELTKVFETNLDDIIEQVYEMQLDMSEHYAEMAEEDDYDYAN